VTTRTTHSKALKEAIANNDGAAVLEHMPDRMKAFCYEYLKDLNATQAVLRAGYDTIHPNRIGSELKNKPAVTVALNYLREDREQKMKIDAGFVLDKIVKSIDRAEKKGNETAVLRGAELLAKHLGMFVDRQEISGPNGDAIRVQEEQVRQTAEQFKSKILSLSKKSNLKLVVDDDDSDERE
jgi:phage terminase small subunit